MAVDGTARILGLIPARGGSKGVPQKNLRPLAGRPLIAYTIQTALQSCELSRVVVSTDSVEIAEVARTFGAEVPFRRPPDLARDETPMIDVVRHAVLELRAHGWMPEFVALLQPTVPFRKVSDLDEGVRRLRASAADALVSVSPVPVTYHARWQFTVDDDRLHPAAGGWRDVPSRRQDLAPTFARNGSLYVFRANVVDTSGSIYGERTIAHVMAGDPPINIDSLSDWTEAERYVEHSDLSR